MRESLELSLILPCQSETFMGTVTGALRGLKGYGAVGHRRLAQQTAPHGAALTAEHLPPEETRSNLLATD